MANSFDQFDAPASPSGQANPFDKFDAPAAKPVGFVRKAADLGLGFASGALGATKSVSDAAGAGNAVSGALDSADKFVQSGLSDQAVADQQAQQAILKESQGKGIIEGVKSAGRAFAVAPVQSTVTGIGSIVPTLAAGLATGGASVPVSLGARAAMGVAQGAGSIKGSIYDDIKQRSAEAKIDPAAAEAAALKAQEYGGPNTGQIALGAALGMGDSVTGVSKVATSMLRKGLGKGAQELAEGSTRGIVARTALGAAGEVPLEVAQGGQQQYASNVASQREGFAVNPWDNVVSQGAFEGLASAGPGAAFGALHGRAAPAALEAAPSVDPGEPAPAPDATPPGLGFNPSAGTHTVFPDGSVILNSDRPEGEQAVFDKRFAPQAGTAAAQDAPAATFASILDTDPVYSTWSNVQDGTDRAIMRDQMEYVGRTYAGKATDENREALNKDLSEQFKWFRNAAPEQKNAALDSLFVQPAAAEPTSQIDTALSAAEANIARTRAEWAAAEQRAKRIAVVGVADAPPNSPLTSAAFIAVDSGAHDAAIAQQNQALAQAGQGQAATENVAASPLTAAAESVQAPAAAPAAPTPQERLAKLNSEIASGTNADTGAKLTPFQLGVRKAQANQIISQLPKDASAGVQPSNDATSQAPQAQPAIESVVSSVKVNPTSSNPVPASWVIKEKATGNVVMETFDQKKVDALNTGKYEAVPILQHLQGLNTPATEPAQPQGVTRESKTNQALPQQTQPEPSAAPVAGTASEVAPAPARDYGDRLPPAKAMQLQEASRVFGRDVTRQQVQSMRDRVAGEVVSGQTNNGGVMVNLKPAAITQRKEQLSRLEQDLALFNGAPATPKLNPIQAAAVAKQKGIDTTGMKPAQVLAAIEADAGPVQLGRNNTPLSEGGKAYKTSLAARDAKKLQPMMRVVAVKDGFVLAEKTEKQVAAEAKAARRLRNPQTSAPGEPIPAHAFIAAEGGLHKDTRADMNIGANPKIGNRTLFAGKGKGISMERATARLIEEGYLSEGAGHNEAAALIKRSLTKPQYNADGIERIALAEEDARYAAYELEMENGIVEAEALDDNEFDALDNDIPWDEAGQPSSYADFLSATGATEQEIQNEIASESGISQASSESSSRPIEAAASDAQAGDGQRAPAQGQDEGLSAEKIGEFNDAKLRPATSGIFELEEGGFEKFDGIWYRGESTPSKALKAEMPSSHLRPTERLPFQRWKRVADFSLDAWGSPRALTNQKKYAAPETLTAPSQQDVIDQQARTEQAAQLDEKAQIDREASKQTLTRQAAPEQRTDTSGDMFAMEKATAEIEKRNAGVAAAKDPNQGGMFDDAPAAAPTPKAADYGEAFTVDINSMFAGVPYRASMPVQVGKGEEVLSTEVIPAKTKVAKRDQDDYGLPGTVYAWRVSAIKAEDGSVYSEIEAMTNDSGRTPDGEVVAYFTKMEGQAFDAITRIAPAIGKAAVKAYEQASAAQAPGMFDAPAPDAKPAPKAEAEPAAVQRIPQSILDLGFKMQANPMGGQQNEARWTSADAAPYTQLTVRHTPKPDTYRVTQGGRFIAALGENALPTKEAGSFTSEADLLAALRPIMDKAKPAAVTNPVTPVTEQTFDQWVKDSFTRNEYRDDYLTEFDGNEKLAMLGAAIGSTDSTMHPAAMLKQAKQAHFDAIMAQPREAKLSMEVFDSLNPMLQSEAQRHFYDMDSRLTRRTQDGISTKNKDQAAARKPYEDALAEIDADIKRLDAVSGPDTAKVEGLRARRGRLFDAIYEIGQGNAPDGRLLKVEPVARTTPYDAARAQELTNSIQEGESILKSGRNVAGKKLTPDELAMVQRSVSSSKAKLDALGSKPSGAMFSRAAKAEPKVENLVTLHNLTAENLLHAAGMGGIAVPSIGITKVESPFGGFGDITLIAPKGMIDPADGTPVFDRDAYTARHPTMNFKKVKAGKADAFYERMKAGENFGERGTGFLSQLWETIKNASTQSPDKVADLFTQYNEPKMMYAKEVLGKDIKIPMRDVRLQSPVASDKAVMAYFKKHEAAVRGRDEVPAAEAAKARAEFAAIVDAAIDRYAATKPNPTAIAKIFHDSMMDEDGLTYRAARDLFDDIPRVGTKEVDRVKLGEAVNKAVPLNDPAYKKWVESLVKPLFEAPTITLRGKEVEPTLSNVVEAMTIGGVAGSEKTMTSGPGKVAAQLGKRFKSLAEIQAARDQIVSEADEEAGKKTTDALLTRYRERVLNFYTEKDWRGQIDTWNGMDAAMDALALAGKNVLTDGNINIALQRKGFKGTDKETLGLAREVIAALRNSATNYFEAKPQRAVRLREFSGAVVPKGTSQEVLDILAANDIEVLGYSKAVEGSKIKAVEKLARALHKKQGDVLFARTAKPATDQPTTGTAKTVRAALAKRFGLAITQMEKRGFLKIWDTTAQFNESGQSSIQIEGAAQGMWTGKVVHLFADGIEPGREVAVLLHEVGEHASMKQMLGDKAYARLVARAHELAFAGNPLAQAALERIPNDTNPQHFDSELLAYMIEIVAAQDAKAAPSARKWLADVVAAIRAWWSQTGFAAKLAGAGIRMELTPKDIAALAVRAVKWQARQESDGQSAGSAPMFSRASAIGDTLKASWNSPEPSKFDDLVYKLQDKQIDTKRVIESIRSTAGALADEKDVYLQEELFHGRAAARSEDFLNKELGPLVNTMKLSGLDIETLDEYLHARHAEEANALIAGRNSEIQDGGSGMTTKAARDYLAKLGPQQRAKLEAAAAKVDAILAGTRQLYADYDLESDATIKGWGDMFKHYVPLMREEKDGGMGIGQGFSIKGRETKSRTGSTRKVVDILANIAMQRERAIVRGEKNRVAVALVGLVKTNPNKDFWHTGYPPSEKVYDAKTNKVVTRTDPMYKSRENVVVAKVRKADGSVVEQAVIFNEDNERALRMSMALKNLDAAQLEGLLGVSAKITRYFAAINTQYNPIFGTVNLARDVQGALLNLSSTPLKGKGKAVAANVLSALKGVYLDARAARDGKTPSSKWAALWDEFQAEGGQTGFRDMFSTSADRAKAIQRELNPEGWMDSPLGKVFTANGALKVPLSVAQKQATGMFGWLSDYNLAMENAVRLSAYKVALEQGMSKQQAASMGKNLTVNFNRKGQVGQQAGALYAFFNASMQGTARLGQTLFDMEPGKPKTLRLSALGKKIVYGGVLLGVMQALLLSAAGFDDEEPPEFVRERSLVIPTGGKGYITIPMPLGLHVLPNLGRIPTEFALGGFKDPAEKIFGLLGLSIGAFNPIGGGASLVQMLSPTAIDPLVALAENKDWTGKPIAKTAYNKAIPGHALAKDTATAPAKLLAEAINLMTGGTEYTAGVLSPTPDQIDYLWGQVTGGVGREAGKVQQTISAGFSGEELPMHKIPLAGRFYGETDTQSAQSSKFYTSINRLNRHEEEIKGLRKDGRGAEVAGYMADNPDARLFMAGNLAERAIQKLRSIKRELVAEGAPAERVKEIEQQITDRMTRFNEMTKQAKAH